MFEGELAADNSLYLMAVEGERLLGYAGMQYVLDEFYIENIAVDPGCRRQGVGLALMEALIAQAREMGGAFVTLEVRPSNVGALGLYTRLGFEPVGRRKDYYEKPREDALLMTLNFEEGPSC